MSAESKLVSAIADACVDFLIERGELNGKLRVTRELHTAARRVVWAGNPAPASTNTRKNP